MATSASASGSEDQQTEESVGVVSCGYCLEVEGYLVNPVKLKCGHMFCEPCLKDHHKNLQVIACRTCKQKTSTNIEDLSPASGVEEAFCDSCSMKGNTKMSARVFCTPCAMKFCAKHEQFHAECYPGHEIVAISSYLASTASTDRRFCTIHKDNPLTVGCSRCWVICCVRCMVTLDPCANMTGDHRLIAVEDLADLAKSKLEPFKKQAEEKFEELSALVKETTIQVSQWDVDTETSVRIIHQARDNQVNGITEKYKELERRYLASRAASKQEMTDFIEADAGVKLSELNTQLKQLRECLNKTHPVDLVTEKEQIQAKIDELVRADLPSLVMSNQVGVSKIDTDNRNIEIEICPHHDIKIGKRTQRIPTSLVLKNEFVVGDFCNTVCHYKGFIYAGKNNGTVARIDAAGNIQNSFLTGLANVTNIRAHNDRLYMLFCQDPRKVIVHSVDGSPVLSWDHRDTAVNRGNKICIIGDQIILANQTRQRLDVYSLTGNLVKQISCPKLPSSGYFSVAPVGPDALIVASDQGVIFTVNHQTGQVIWTSSHKFKDTAVVALNDATVLLSGAECYSGSKELLVKVLNIKTDPAALIVASDQGVIFTVNHQTGQTIWTSSHKFKDTAVVALNDETVLLSGFNYYAQIKKILVKILNFKTDIMTELRAGEMTQADYTFDMSVHEDTLWLIGQSERKVYQFKLQYD